MKLCKTCKEIKEVSEFYHRSDTGKFRSACKCCIRKRNLDYIEKNKEIKLESDRRYYLENKSYFVFKKAKRRAIKKCATPSWLTKEHLYLIKEIYKDCSTISKNTNIEHQVDHIIPLNSSLVCGLHVPWNLQIITKNENLKKSNFI